MTVTAKKRRTWLGLFLRGAAVLSALFAVGVVWMWVLLSREAAAGRRARDTVLAELDATDPRWRWEQMQADFDPIPDAENAALVVLRVGEALGKRKLPEGLEQRPEPNRRLDDGRLTLLREELGEVEAAVALAVTLEDYPRGRARVELADDVIGTLLPHFRSVQEAVRLLELDAERLLHAGRAADVPDRVRAILRAGACLRDDPFLIGSVLRFKIRRTASDAVLRLLGLGEPSDAACRALIADLEAERREDILLAGLRGDRAGFHRLFENIESGKVPLGGGPARGSGDLWPSAYSYLLPDDHAYLLRQLTDACDVARLPPELQPEAWDAFEAEISEAMRAAEAGRRRLFFRLTMPAAWKVGAAAMRDRALLSCAVAALAAERYRIANGRWPDSLEDVRPRFVAELPHDPSTGGSLVYERHEEGVTIRGVSEEAEARLYDPGRRGVR